MAETPYARLEKLFLRLSALADAEAVLNWDQATMMPRGGAGARAGQVAELRAVSHSMISAPETGDWLDVAEAGDGLDAWQAANLYHMRRRWTHATALDETLVRALTEAESACETAWRTARPEADFAAVLPSLQAVLDLVREAAAAKAGRLGLAPYDALLDQYEPGARAEEIDPVFDELEDFLPALLADVLAAQAAHPKAQPPPGPFPAGKQRALGMRLMEAFGFDFDHGRLDESLHPFCGGVPEDIRITTRYDEDDFASGLMGVLHETGHALYDRGLPRAWRGQPVGDAIGMAVHESQSLLIEMQVCRSRPFMDFAAPLIAEAFSGYGPEWEAENLHRLAIRVRPGFIRVDADEVTYPVHVILRYRLEKAMIEGAMEAADLPGAWNQGMERALGITPPSDREGCLQDVHWYDGAWGYFPTYTLGAMTAAQLFQAADGAEGAIGEGIARGDFAPLLAWLGDNVHAKGSLLTSDQMLTAATGRPLEANAFKAHLKRRYQD